MQIYKILEFLQIKRFIIVKSIGDTNILNLCSLPRNVFIYAKSLVHGVIWMDDNEDYVSICHDEINLSRQTLK